MSGSSIEVFSIYKENHVVCDKNTWETEKTLFVSRNIHQSLAEWKKGPFDKVSKSLQMCHQSFDTNHTYSMPHHVSCKLYLDQIEICIEHESNAHYTEEQLFNPRTGIFHQLIMKDLRDEYFKWPTPDKLEILSGFQHEKDGCSHPIMVAFASTPMFAPFTQAVVTGMIKCESSWSQNYVVYPVNYESLSGATLFRCYSNYDDYIIDDIDIRQSTVDNWVHKATRNSIIEALFGEDGTPNALIIVPLQRYNPQIKKSHRRLYKKMGGVLGYDMGGFANVKMHRKARGERCSIHCDG